LLRRRSVRRPAADHGAIRAAPPRGPAAPRRRQAGGLLGRGRHFRSPRQRVAAGAEGRRPGDDYYDGRGRRQPRRDHSAPPPRRAVDRPLGATPPPAPDARPPPKPARVQPMPRRPSNPAAASGRAHVAYEQVVIPERAGAFTLAAPRFSYFDPGTATYRTLTAA